MASAGAGDGATFGGTWTGEELDGAEAIARSVRQPADLPRAGDPLPRLVLAADGAFALEQELGRGGMGVVVAAHDAVLERSVAIKQLADGGSTAAAAALIAEARVLARLDHPNIVPVHQLGQDADGRPIVVMKRVRGRRWTDLLRGGRDLERDLDIALEVMHALAFAHDRGVVHRDVKPDNVMVGAFGEVYLMDWGCSCEVGSTTGPIVGTPGYLAPEQLAGGAPLGAATDVFLMGATLHEALLGGRRHTGDSLREVLEAAAQCQPPSYPPGTPTELVRLLDRACARHPEDRFPTIDALAAAVRAWRSHREADAMAQDAADRLPGLRAAIEAGDRSADACVSEIRVSLRAAQRAWPEGRTAPEALIALADLVVPWKLAADEPGAVEALLPDLPAAERARHEAALAAARARIDAARAAARAADVRVGARERRNAMGLLLGGAVFVVLAVWLRMGDQAMAPWDVVVAGAWAVLLVTSVFVPFWTALTRHRLTRAMLGAVWIMTVASLASRTMAWWFNEPASITLRTDALWFGALLCVVALFGEPGVALAGAVYVVTALAMMARPEAAGFLFPVGAFPATALGAYVLSRRVRREPGEGEVGR